MTSSDLLRDQWSSLGIAFASKSANLVDPETALIGFAKSHEFPRDRKMMGLILLWLNEFSKLVHVERLRLMANDLLPDEVAVLGGIANKCVANGDLRFGTLVTLAKTTGGGHALADTDSYLEMKGVDSEFNEVGIRVGLVAPSKAAKLMPRERIIRSNLWLKNRLLFGSNVRADIATVKSLKLAGTGYAAAKLLRCSPNAAYRNWKDLDEAGWL